MVKGGVNGFGRKHGNKCAKPMKMEGSEDVPGEFCQVHTVTVEGPPIPFSPFSLANCTMLSHFSFNDFVVVAFPDLAGDLDIQI